MYIVIGTHKVVPTQNSIIIAAKYHKYDWLLDDRGNYKEPINWEDLHDLYFIEIQIFGQYEVDLILKISQDDQAPYLEFYLDPSGTQLIDEETAIKVDGRRLCFFIHFLNLNNPLKVGDRRLDLPPSTEIPQRLKRFIHYVPVD